MRLSLRTINSPAGCRLQWHLHSRAGFSLGHRKDVAAQHSAAAPRRREHAVCSTPLSGSTSAHHHDLSFASRALSISSPKKHLPILCSRHHVIRRLLKNRCFRSTFTTFPQQPRRECAPTRWRRSSVVRTSVFGRRTFPALCSICGSQVTNLLVNWPLWVGQTAEVGK